MRSILKEKESVLYFVLQQQIENKSFDLPIKIIKNYVSPEELKRKDKEYQLLYGKKFV